MERFEIFTICRRPPVLQTDASVGMMTGSKLVPEVSPWPELHCEALRKIFRPPSAEQ